MQLFMAQSSKHVSMQHRCTATCGRKVWPRPNRFIDRIREGREGRYLPCERSRVIVPLVKSQHADMTRQSQTRHSRCVSVSFIRRSEATLCISY